MKKLLMVCVFALAGMTSASAIGVGALWGSSAGYKGWGISNGIGLSVGLGDIGEQGNWDFGLRLWGGNGVFSLHLQADYILWAHNFDPSIDWFNFGLYVGGGAYAGLHFFSGGGRFDLGGRLPLGVRLMFIDNLDVWFAFVPSIGLGFGTGGFGIGGGLGGEFGIRWWF